MAFQRTTGNTGNSNAARPQVQAKSAGKQAVSGDKVYPKYRLRMASLSEDGKVAQGTEFIQICNLFEQVKDDGSIHYSGKSEDGTSKFFLMPWNPKKEG
jgi:hypothetical protein